MKHPPTLMSEVYDSVASDPLNRRAPEHPHVSGSSEPRHLRIWARLPPYIDVGTPIPK